MDTVLYAVVYRNDLLNCQSVSFVSDSEPVAIAYAEARSAMYDSWKVIPVPAKLIHTLVPA